MRQELHGFARQHAKLVVEVSLWFVLIGGHTCLSPVPKILQANLIFCGDTRKLDGACREAESSNSPRRQYSSFNKTTRRVGRMLFLMPQRLYVLAPPSPQICRPAKYQIRASLETRPVANTERRLGTPSPEREAFQKYHATVVNPVYCASN